MIRRRRPSEQMLSVLRALASQPQRWRYGYDLMKETGLGSGTLYPLLMRMKEQGLVDAEWHSPAEPGRPARHAYRLTAAGTEVARETLRPEGPSSLKASPA